MHINKYCFSSKKTVIKQLSVKRPRGRFMCGSRNFLLGGGGGGAGVHTRLFPSPQRILQWFINGLFRVKLFLGEGGWGRVV